MVPAQQRLRPHDPSRREADDRLIADAELPELERLTKLAVKLEPRELARMHRRLEDLEPAPVRGFCQVHGGVGVPEELHRCDFRIATIERNPDARSRADRAAIDVQRA